nr:MAG TPA: hypothetical protein [Caudoviricetes sp.]
MRIVGIAVPLSNDTLTKIALYDGTPWIRDLGRAQGFNSPVLFD